MRYIFAAGAVGSLAKWGWATWPPLPAIRISNPSDYDL